MQKMWVQSLLGQKILAQLQPTPDALAWEIPRTERSLEGWVLQSQKKSDMTSIKHNKSVLKGIGSSKKHRAEISQSKQVCPGSFTLPIVRKAFILHRKSNNTGYSKELIDSGWLSRSWAQTGFETLSLGLWSGYSCSLKASKPNTPSSKKKSTCLRSAKHRSPAVPGPKLSIQSASGYILKPTLRLCSGGEGRVSQVVI